MPIRPSRRQFLQAMGSTLLAPAITNAAAIADAADVQRRTRRRKVGIVGGGIAGVAAAWLLDGDCDVVLFEAEAHLGGHAHTITVDYRGRQVAVDVGAQNFAPTTHPTYSKLLQLLGLFDPTDLSQSPTVTVPLSLTVYGAGGATPLFVSPYPDRTWPLAETWNTPALAAFTGLIAAAQELEKNDLDWTVTLEDWIESTAISREQKDGLVYPFVASLNNSQVDAAKALSARASIYFVSRALPDNPFAGVTYYNSLFGLGGIVQKLADDCTTLTVRTGAPVRHVTRRGPRYRIVTDDDQELVDHLILATPPYIAEKLVRRLPHARRIGKALASFPYFPATITIHTDPAFAPADRKFWSFDNVEVGSGLGQGSLWYGAIHPPLADGSTVDVFKSWTTYRDAPQAPIYSEAFLHALPSPEFGRAQVALDRFQGKQRLWFVGSHCIEVDSQDTALRSAMRVADALTPTSPHYVALKTAIGA